MPERSGDEKLGEIIGSTSSRMLREYLAEMKRQGRIEGSLYVIFKDGKRQVKRPFRKA